MNIPVRYALAADYPADIPHPSYAHEGDAGLDLVAIEEAVIDGDEATPRRTFRTGLHVEIPAGYVGLICPRSGLAKRGVIAILGVLDSSFRGEVKVSLLNHSILGHHVNIGDRIAQLLIVPCVRADLMRVELGDLTETTRGAGGHGSTGR